MKLTDEEIKRILIKEKRKKARRRKMTRRITALIVLIFAIVISIGIYVNRDKVSKIGEGRGIIYINAGHGGVDGGTSGYGRLEKDDNLKLALKVRDYLEDKNFDVVMARETDEDVDASQRSKEAEDVGAQIMVSLHRNQVNDGEARGVEIWISSDNPSDDNLLSENILNALVKNGFESRGVRSGTLTDPNDDYYENIIKGMTSCLIEVGFVSDKSDNKLFDNKLDENAKAIADAIELSFEQLYEKDSSGN
ncbi:MAG: N-acetylmuramoyl-L-alanine amidase [Clostridiales bacterium]|nr:N-acetylmuramoyl-L-alanine amidase [Clostridiales bacterium]